VSNACVTRTKVSLMSQASMSPRSSGGPNIKNEATEKIEAFKKINDQSKLRVDPNKLRTSVVVGKLNEDSETISQNK